MIEIICPGCETELSSEIERCPFCGEDLSLLKIAPSFLAAAKSARPAVTTDDAPWKPLIPGADKWRRPLAVAEAQTISAQSSEVTKVDVDLDELFNDHAVKAPPAKGSIQPAAAQYSPVREAERQERPAVVETSVSVDAEPELIELEAAEQLDAESQVGAVSTDEIQQIVDTDFFASDSFVDASAVADHQPVQPQPREPVYMDLPELEQTAVDETPFGQAGGVPSAEETAQSDPASMSEDTIERVVDQAFDRAPAGSVVRAALAPLWRRALASLIDTVPVAAAAGAMLFSFEKRLDLAKVPMLPHSLDELSNWYWALGKSLYLLVAVVAFVAFFYQLLSLVFMQGTAGDIVLGIRWLTRRGQRPPWWRALWRALLLVPSWALLLTGPLSFLFTRGHRPLYDVLSGLYPVRSTSLEYAEAEANESTNVAIADESSPATT